MRALWRTWWICVLLLALPLQGLAAGVRVHCAPASSPAVVAPDHHAAHDPGPHAAHGHGHGHDHAAAAADPGGADRCSACAWCCLGVGLPALAWSLAGPVPGRALAPAPVPPVPKFLTDGPERPPRLHLG